ncbi:MAG: S-layer homology domain-containing protein [Tissierellia bacterium]|nr:S-layer homology domain-containing protein [Tissierellia bacterium]MDD4780621.1 S-layer homology domain-containing protein [Tissierellia bacterium]
MKFKKVLFFIIILLVLSIQPGLAKTVYYDIYGHWATDDINFASNTLKVFKGYGDLTFRPENEITRAEFITILARTAYKQNKMNEVYTSSMAYNDMSMKHWSYTFVISMYEHFAKNNKDYSFKDIFPGNYFYPDSAIKREEAVALVAAFSDKSIYDNPLNFSDISTNHKYYNQIKRLYNAGIISGYKDNTFRGNAKITRAESAALIKRVYNDIKTSDSSKYLKTIEFLPIKGDDMYSYFGNYNFNTTNTLDQRFIKAKNTLEYVSFGGYIFPEDAHLYDMKAVDTMNSLRASGYYNVAGTNFYLITFGNFSESAKTEFANQILANIIARDDLNDSELMQLFALVTKYDTKEYLYINALKKWHSNTINNNAKANILFFRYAYYIRTNNQSMLKTLVYDDLTKANNISNLININWDLTAGSTTDFRNYSFNNYTYHLYKNMTLNSYLLNSSNNFNYNSTVVELVQMLLIKKINPPTSVGVTNNEDIFYKYSLNRLYVLNFINEKERAFVEGINDYEILKTFDMYKTKKTEIDDNYVGILKKVK